MRTSLGNSEKLQETDSILSRAEELREKSQYHQSLRLFKEAAKRFTKIKDFDGMYRCMLASGDLYRMTGDFALAENSYREALDAARRLNSAVDVADAKVGLGLALRAQGKWRDAIKLIGEAKRTYQKKEDTHGIAFTLWAEAGALRIKGDIPGALEGFSESHKIFKSMKDSHGVGYCLCGLGGASRMAGLFADSLKYYTTANGLFASAGDRFGKAYSYCGIGNAHRMLGDYKKALTFFSKAEGVYKNIGDMVSYAYTLWGIGTACKMTGDHVKARNYFLEALRLFKKTKDPRGIIYCDLGFGEISLLEGKLAAAKKYLSSALNGTKEHSFALERCHAETLISFMNAASASTKAGAKRPLNSASCYDRLGLKLVFQTLPLNIP
jgi:tetratricopeptide (TPR) repeat protein